MIIIHNRRGEHPCRDAFQTDYRRARAALILHLAADTGVQCHHHLRYPEKGYLDDITITATPRTNCDFTDVRDFLEGLQENGLLSHFEDVEEQELTPDERSWFADYGLCSVSEPPDKEPATEESQGGK